LFVPSLVPGGDHVPRSRQQAPFGNCLRAFTCQSSGTKVARGLRSIYMNHAHQHMFRISFSSSEQSEEGAFCNPRVGAKYTRHACYVRRCAWRSMATLYMCGQSFPVTRNVSETASYAMPLKQSTPGGRLATGNNSRKSYSRVTVPSCGSICRIQSQYLSDSDSP
jgi:hypothetical protein